MHIAIIGAGRIGSNIARRASRAGHDLTLAFARDLDALHALADELGASVATPADAVAGAEMVVVSVPWSVVPDAIEQAGDFAGRVVVDTTNQFGSGPMPATGETAAAFNAHRMTGARYVKSFNTLTASFQAAAADRGNDERVVQWICGDDTAANDIVAHLIEEMGYAPVELGGTRDCAVMEAPRRSGSVYGEEYRLKDALAVVEAVRAGRPIPPTPVYA